MSRRVHHDPMRAGGRPYAAHMEYRSDRWEMVGAVVTGVVLVLGVLVVAALFVLTLLGVIR